MLNVLRKRLLCVKYYYRNHEGGKTRGGNDRRVTVSVVNALTLVNIKIDLAQTGVRRRRRWWTKTPRRPEDVVLWSPLLRWSSLRSLRDNESPISHFSSSFELAMGSASTSARLCRLEQSRENYKATAFEQISKFN